jgi:hypothetical protein
MVYLFLARRARERQKESQARVSFSTIFSRSDRLELAVRSCDKVVNKPEAA